VAVTGEVGRATAGVELRRVRPVRSGILGQDYILEHQNAGTPDSSCFDTTDIVPVEKPTPQRKTMIGGANPKEGHALITAKQLDDACDDRWIAAKTKIDGPHGKSCRGDAARLADVTPLFFVSPLGRLCKKNMSCARAVRPLQSPLFSTR
jgi:hypothetical protein